MALPSLVGVRLMYLLIFIRVYYFFSGYSSWGGLCFGWFLVQWVFIFVEIRVENIPAWYERPPILILVSHTYWNPQSLYWIYSSYETFQKEFFLILSFAWRKNTFSLVQNQVHFSIRPHIFDVNIIVIPTWIDKTLVAKINMHKIGKEMTLHHEKYERKRWWVFLFIVNPNLHYHHLSINKRWKGCYFKRTSLITIKIQISNTKILWV